MALSKGQTTIEAVIVGYDERTGLSSKTGKHYHIAEVYYYRKRKEKEEKHQYGAVADSFTYFFSESETSETCDISEILEDLREDYTLLVEMEGRFVNYKFNPSKIEVKERV